jgi:hypothetical protein
MHGQGLILGKASISRLCHGVQAKSGPTQYINSLGIGNAFPDGSSQHPILDIYSMEVTLHAPYQEQVPRVYAEHRAATGIKHTSSSMDSLQLEALEIRTCCDDKI